jgi:hypothetical protein
MITIISFRVSSAKVFIEHDKVRVREHDGIEHLITGVGDHPQARLATAWQAAAHHLGLGKKPPEVVRDALLALV